MGVDAAVLQLRRGDPDALATLMARYQNRVYRYLLRLVRQPADADDLFQQTWLRVAEKIRSFDTSRNFDAWLFTLARNLAFDHLRRARPRRSAWSPAKVHQPRASSSKVPRADHQASLLVGEVHQNRVRSRAWRFW